MELSSFYGTKTEEEAYRLLVWRHAIYLNATRIRLRDPSRLSTFLLSEGYRTGDSAESAIDAWNQVRSAQMVFHLRAGYIEELTTGYRAFRKKVMKEAGNYRLPGSPNDVAGRSAKRLLIGYLAVTMLGHPVAGASWEENLREAGKVISRYRIMSEELLEGWLFFMPGLLEEGLIFTRRQVRAGDGRIDLVGRDRSGRVVLCELKREEDRDVLWQAAHYPKAYGRENGVPQEEIRMLVVAPYYSDSLLEELTLCGAELYRYEQNGGLRVMRIQTTGNPL